MKKICTSCGIEKELSEFNKHKSYKYGVRAQCRDCEKIYKKGYRKNNKKKINKYNLYWHSLHKEERKKHRYNYERNNKDRIIETRKIWSDKNRGKLRKQQCLWRKNNRDKCNAKCAKRRAMKLQRTPYYANLEKIKEYYLAADILSHFMGEPYHVDHIIPLNGKLVCGLHHEGNLQVIPARENLIKHNKFVPIITDFNTRR
jgi:hypothetical protein